MIELGSRSRLTIKEEIKVHAKADNGVIPEQKNPYIYNNAGYCPIVAAPTQCHAGAHIEPEFLPRRRGPGDYTAAHAPAIPGALQPGRLLYEVRGSR